MTQPDSAPTVGDTPATPTPPTPNLVPADVPFTPPVTSAPVVAKTQADAVTTLVEDLGARAFHAFWQSGTASLAALWVSSGVDVHSLTHLSSTAKVVIPLLAAAGASGLSAAKTVIVSYFSAKKV